MYVHHRMPSLQGESVQTVWIVFIISRDDLCDGVLGRLGICYLLREGQHIAFYAWKPVYMLRWWREWSVDEFSTRTSPSGHRLRFVRPQCWMVPMEEYAICPPVRPNFFICVVGRGESLRRGLRVYLVDTTVSACSPPWKHPTENRCSLIAVRQGWNFKETESTLIVRIEEFLCVSCSHHVDVEC